MFLVGHGSRGWWLGADGSNFDILHCCSAVAMSCAASSVQRGRTDLYGAVKNKNDNQTGIVQKLWQSVYGSWWQLVSRSWWHREAGGSGIGHSMSPWGAVVALCVSVGMKWVASSKRLPDDIYSKTNQPATLSASITVTLPLPLEADGGRLDILDCCNAVALSCAASFVQSGSINLYGTKKLKNNNQTGIVWKLVVAGVWKLVASRGWWHLEAGGHGIGHFMSLQGAVVASCVLVLVCHGSIQKEAAIRWNIKNNQSASPSALTFVTLPLPLGGKYKQCTPNFLSLC